jgi:hypothetical protein
MRRRRRMMMMKVRLEGWDSAGLVEGLADQISPTRWRQSV